MDYMNGGFTEHGARMLKERLRWVQFKTSDIYTIQDRLRNAEREENLAKTASIQKSFMNYAKLQIELHENLKVNGGSASSWDPTDLCKLSIE